MVVLGSTGSIGCNTLDVIRRMKNRFDVVGLAANKNAGRLRQQIRSFSPSYVAMGDSSSAAAVMDFVKKTARSVQVFNNNNYRCTCG